MVAISGLPRAGAPCSGEVKLLEPRPIDHGPDPKPLTGKGLQISEGQKPLVVGFMRDLAHLPEQSLCPLQEREAACCQRGEVVEIFLPHARPVERAWFRAMLGGSHGR
jgi:hypothetical protein